MRRYLKFSFVAVIVLVIVVVQIAGGPHRIDFVTLAGLVIAVGVVGGTPLWLRIRSWPFSDMPRFGSRRS